MLLLCFSFFCPSIGSRTKPPSSSTGTTVVSPPNVASPVASRKVKTAQPKRLYLLVINRVNRTNACLSGRDQTILSAVGCSFPGDLIVNLHCHLSNKYLTWTWKILHDVTWYWQDLLARIHLVKFLKIFLQIFLLDHGKFLQVFDKILEGILAGIP